jgi:hypothetical protein
VGDNDEPLLERLKDVGFQIVAPDEFTWTAPKPFKLSAGR